MLGLEGSHLSDYAQAKYTNILVGNLLRKSRHWSLVQPMGPSDCASCHVAIPLKGLQRKEVLKACAEHVATP